MNKRTSTYIVLILFNLLYVSKGRACSDMLFTENFGTIDLRYTSFCPEYIDSDKLKELSDYLISVEDETEIDVMILINRIPIKDSKNQFISLAIDTLREFDRTLAQDFNSFYTYQNLWRESELNSKLPGEGCPHSNRSTGSFHEDTPPLAQSTKEKLIN